MEFKVVVSIVLATAAAVIFRGKCTQTVSDAHFRQQLFVSDSLGTSPLEVEEAKARLKLWRGSWDVGQSQQLIYETRGEGGRADIHLAWPITAQGDGKRGEPEAPTTFGSYGASHLHLPPIIVCAIVWFDSFGHNMGPYGMYIVNILFEASMALCLASILKTSNRMEAFSMKTLDERSLPKQSIWIAVIYLLNPLSIAFPLYGSPRSLVLLPLLAAIVAASSQSRAVRTTAPIFLAFALYVFPLVPLALVLPVGHLLYASKYFFVNGIPVTVSPYNETAALIESSSDAALLQPCPCAHCVCPDKSKVLGSLLCVLKFALMVAAWYTTLQLISFWLMGYSWDYLRSTIGDLLLIVDMRPNIGVFWYAFQLIFDRFRKLFVFYFYGHVFIHVSALYMRMFYLPVSHTIMALATLLLFQPYPSALDYVLLVCILLVRPSTVNGQKSFVVLVALGCFTLGMIPVMVTLWLQRGTGNPNFVYFMQMIHLASGGFLVVGWVIQVLDKFKNVVRPRNNIHK